MGTGFRQWVKDVWARLASQAIVTLIFATIPIIGTLWEWRGIIVADHERQMVLDSMLVRHLSDYQKTKERVDMLEWKRQTDSLRIDFRFTRVEGQIDVLQRVHTHNKQGGIP